MESLGIEEIRFPTYGLSGSFVRNGTTALCQDVFPGVFFPL